MGLSLLSLVARLFGRRRAVEPPPAAAPESRPEPEPEPRLESDRCPDKEALHNLHCHARSSRGLAHFARTDRLDDAAQALADAMARELLVAHRAGGSTPEERLWAMGVSADMAAEVIAVGQRRAVDVFAAIVRDPATRLCVVQPTLYAHVGYGLAADAAGRHYWCVVYAGAPCDGPPRVYAPDPLLA